MAQHSVIFHKHVVTLPQMNSISGGLFSFRNSFNEIVADDAMLCIPNVYCEERVLNEVIFYYHVVRINQVNCGIVIQTGVSGVFKNNSFDYNVFSTYSENLVLVLAIKNRFFYSDERNRFRNNNISLF